MFKPIQFVSIALCALLLVSGCSTTIAPTTDRIDANLLTQNHAEQRKQQVKAVDYRLSLAIDKDLDNFSGTMVIDFELAQNNQKPLTIDFEEGQIEQLKVNGKTIDPHYKRYFIVIAPQHLVPGKNTISISYNRPYSTDGNGFHRRQEEDSDDVYLFSDFQTYNANRMYPAFDQPDLKATFTLDVIAPKDWHLISATREHNIVDKGNKKHWFFKPTKRITTYVFSLHAGTFHMWQDNSGKYPLRLFARKQVAEHIDAAFWFNATHKSLDYLERYFDIPYPYEKYDQVIVPEYREGAMENVAAVVFDEDYYVSEEPLTKFIKDELVDTIAHEAAHMWFGNLVTMQWWNGLWLNESFASYMAIVAMNQGVGVTDAWQTFNGNFKSWGYRADELVTTHPIELPVKDTDVADSIFDGITYGKGAAVVAQLSHYLGEEKFKQGIQSYFKKHAGGNTTLTDFMGELGKVANKDLTRWTQDWLYSAGVNTIAADIQCDNGLVTRATILQSPDKADGVLREHLVRVGFYRNKDGKVSAYQTYDVHLNGEVNDIHQAVGQTCPPFAYANTDDLGYVKVNLQNQDLPFLKAQLSNFEDSQLRQMLWQDLWHKVKNASMSFSRYVELVKIHYPKEQDETQKLSMIYTLQAAFRYLLQLPGDQAKQLRQDLEQFAWQQIDIDGQSQTQVEEAFDFFTDFAHSDWGLNMLRKMLLGEQPIAGLELSQQQRWNIVRLLNRYQYKDYQRLLEQEFSQDASDSEKSLTEVARPSMEAKQRWLDIMIEAPKSVDFRELRDVMYWIYPVEQSELRTQVLQRLLDGLATISDSTGLRYQTTYAERMLKGSCSAESVERLKTAVERYQHISSKVLDKLRINLQSDQRCYDIRQFNQS